MSWQRGLPALFSALLWRGSFTGVAICAQMIKTVPAEYPQARFLFDQVSVGTSPARPLASVAWPRRVRCIKSIWLNSQPSSLASRK